MKQLVRLLPLYGAGMLIIGLILTMVGFMRDNFWGIGGGLFLMYLGITIITLFINTYHD